jgi:predicted phage tail protein
MTRKRPTPKGFGAKKPKQPVTDEVSGISSAFAEFIGAISSGPIEGLVNGAQSIYLDDTPAQDPDGTYNFSEFKWWFRPGTQNQALIRGITQGVFSETPVGAEVRYLFPVSRTITNPNLDSIRITLSVVLQEAEDDGDVKENDVSYEIRIRQGAGALVLRESRTIKGRYPTQTNFEVQFPVNNLGGTVEEFEVEITRTTDDDDDDLQNQRILRWESYTECIDDKFNYPHTALMAVRVDREQFDNIPQFSYEMYGVRNCRIPTNATVNMSDRGLDYSGTWDGTFKSAGYAISDPAWQLFDLLTHPEEGLGQEIKISDLNKWHYYALSKYCNELVNDGKGGLERRFSSNIYLTDRKDANEVIEGFRSIFNGFTYYLNGVINLGTDMPRDPIRQFVPADVENGEFRYTRPGLRSLKTEAIVTYIDPETWERDTVTVRLPAQYRQKYGEGSPLEMSAFACTSQGQARRAGLAALIGNIEGKIVTFKSRMHGVICVPGDLIDIYDYETSQYTGGGLIKEATAGEVTLDRAVRIRAGFTYLLSVMMPDGTRQERAIANLPGDHTVLTLPIDFTEAPEPEASWILASASLQRSLWTVLDVISVPESNNTLYEINALYHNPDKFDLIENGQILPAPRVRNRPSQTVSLPRNVRAIARVRYNTETGITGVDLDCRWDAPLRADGTRDPFISSYFFEYRVFANGVWVNRQTLKTRNIVLSPAPRGNVYIRVAAIDINGRVSKWVRSAAVGTSFVSGEQPNYAATANEFTTLFFTD